MCKYSSEFCGTQLERQSRDSTPCISLGLQQISVTDSTVKQHTKKATVDLLCHVSKTKSCLHLQSHEDVFYDKL